MAPVLLLKLTKLSLADGSTTGAAMWTDTGCWVASSGEQTNVFGSCSPTRLSHPHPTVCTTIYTDMWKAYDSLSWCGFQHGTVNHSQHFVDPVTGVHTNSIEGSWTHAKKKLKNHSTSEDLFASHLAEYLWRKKYRNQSPFAHLINQLTVLYPV